MRNFEFTLLVTIIIIIIIIIVIIIIIIRFSGKYLHPLN